MPSIEAVSFRQGTVDATHPFSLTIRARDESRLRVDDEVTIGVMAVTYHKIHGVKKGKRVRLRAYMSHALTASDLLYSSGGCLTVEFPSSSLASLLAAAACSYRRHGESTTPKIGPVNAFVRVRRVEAETGARSAAEFTNAVRLPIWVSSLVGTAPDFVPGGYVVGRA